MDLTHIDQTIQAKQNELDSMHHQAQTQRDLADAQHDSGNSAGAQPYEHEATHLEQKAQVISKELANLHAQRQSLEQQVHGLEQQRDKLMQTFESQMAQLNNKISALRGGGM